MEFVTTEMTYQMDMRQLSANAFRIEMYNILHVIPCTCVVRIKYASTGECRFIIRCNCYKELKQCG